MAMPRRVLALVTDTSGQVKSASPSAVSALGPIAGRRCVDMVRANGVDGGKVCTQTCVYDCHDGKPPVEVRVRGKTWRMFCAGSGEDRVVVLSPTGGDVSGTVTLSPREHEVLELIAEGFTNARIARRLELSASTVRTHIEHILEKLEVRTRAAAVARAFEAGMIQR